MVSESEVYASTDFFTDVQMEKYGELSINIVSLCAENLLSHPFIVVRRQCQVRILTTNQYILFSIFLNFFMLPQIFIAWVSIYEGKVYVATIFPGTTWLGVTLSLS